MAQVFQEGSAQQSSASRPLLDECKEITPQESDFAMEWDEPEEQLAPELLFLFHAVGKGDRKLELREVLQYFPRFGDVGDHRRTITEGTAQATWIRNARHSSRRSCTA